MINKSINKRSWRTGLMIICLNSIAAFSLFFVFICLLSSCRESYVPRPYGYYRVTIPEHSYRNFDSVGLPYKFDVSKIAEIKPNRASEEKFWIDVVYPQLNAQVHGSYKEINHNMYELSEDTWKFINAHISLADNVTSLEFEHPEKSVYGVLYDIKGNIASPVQFVLTDSTKHFFRGALYFNNKPNKDSIAPMLEYVREDIIRLVETFEWKP